MQNGLDWSQPIRVLIKGYRNASSANGILSLRIGPDANTLSARGIGIDIRNQAIWLLAHDGTTLTQTNTGASISGVFAFDLRASGGTVQLYNKGVLVGSTTGGPTTIANSSENNVVWYWTNGADASNQDFWMERVVNIIGG